MYLLNTNIYNNIDFDFRNNNFIIISINKPSTNDADCVVINELILLNSSNNIIPYDVDIDNIYDDSSNGPPSNWTRAPGIYAVGLWNYERLNDGRWAYKYNNKTVNFDSSAGSNNCTAFCSTSGISWCEFSITINNTISDIKKIQLYLGCNDSARDIGIFNFYTSKDGIKPIINSTRFIDTNNAKLLGNITNDTHSNTPILFSVDIG
jgi:hypothetical protein